MNREDIKHVLYENLDLLQSRIDKSIEPISERLKRLEKEFNEIKSILEQDNTEY
jgi:hypothetical protein